MATPLWYELWDVSHRKVIYLVCYAVLNSAAPEGRVGSNPTPGTHFRNVSVGPSTFQNHLKSQVTVL